MAGRVESTGGKGEIARTSSFSFSPKCFQKTYSAEALKQGLVWETINRGESTLHSLCYGHYMIEYEPCSVKRGFDAVAECIDPVGSACAVCSGSLGPKLFASGSCLHVSVPDLRSMIGQGDALTLYHTTPTPTFNDPRKETF